MAIFEIEGPDGSVYEVDAPDQASAVGAFKRMMGSGGAVPAPEGQGFGNDVAASVGDGLFMGWGDEISARLNALTGYDARTGTYGNDSSYDEQLAAVRREEEDFRREHPVVNLGANIAGGIAPVVAGVGLVGNAPRAVGLAGRSLPALMGRSAVVGSGLGAAQGYAEGEGGFGNRVDSAIPGFVIGGVLGGLTPAGAEVARHVWRAGEGALRNRAVGREVGEALGVQPATGRLVSRILAAEDPQAMQQALNRAGPDAMLADASFGLTSGLDTALQSPVPGVQAARGRINDRAGQGYSAIMDALSPAQGPVQPRAARIRGVQQGSQGARQQAYDAAYANTIDWQSPAGERLRDLMGTTPANVMTRAGEIRSMRVPATSSRMASYGDDAQEVVARGLGADSWLTREQDEIDQFFEAYNGMSGKGLSKRPLSATIKKLGGVDPNSAAGKELKGMGLTSRNSPGLFRRGGLKDVDNLSPDLFPDTVRHLGDGTGNYMDRNAILQSLRDEMNGTATRSTDEAVDASYAEMMERMVPEYQARQAELDRIADLPNAPPAPSDVVPTATVEDIDMVKRALDDIVRGETDPITRVTTGLGAEAGNRARSVRDALIEAAPGYDEALALGRDTIRQREAIDFGAKLIRPGIETDVALEKIAQASEPERALMRESVFSQIKEVMGNVRAVPSDQNIDARQAAAAFSELSRPNTRLKLQALFEDKWPAVEQVLDQAGSALGLRANVATNSKTGAREFFNTMLNEEVAAGPIRSLQPLGSARQIGQSVLGSSPEAIGRARDEVKAEIAELLTRQGGAPQKTISAVVQALASNPANPAAGSKVADALLAAGITATPATTERVQRLLGQLP